ncbi:hypothetical protein FGO68_gene6506 [Halteria grandinella]|uniref:Uncharacterized protein n=1 Tax=Halteria grandinella TaxID=5974 RepID=A0A8J8N9F8_HALGN|nr:hypothetical protein FGO68_gene6506 [Halteria grandinella]
MPIDGQKPQKLSQTIFQQILKTRISQPLKCSRARNKKEAHRAKKISWIQVMSFYHSLLGRLMFPLLKWSK